MAADIPSSLQTTYAELLERCATADFDETFGEDGIFTPKVIRGRRYWYFQTTENGTRRQLYVGPESADLLERIAKHRQARNDRKERQALVSALVRAARLPHPVSAMGEAIAALAREGVFRLRGVLIGTVAYQTYASMLGTRFPKDTESTDDIDIAQFRAISVSIGDATRNMLEVLRKVDPSFRPIPHSHDQRHVTTYATADIRVEFLTPNRGPDTDAPGKLPALGTDAQQLRFLDFLIRDPEPAVVLYGAGVYVRVPAPPRYAIHKLIVSQRRSIGSAKSEKDLRQAQSLLDVLLRRRPYDLRSAWEEAYGRGKAWRQLLLRGLSMVDHMIRDAALKLVDLPRKSIPELTLHFDAPPGRYDSDRDTVFFTGSTGRHALRCAISRQALDDHFGADGFDQKSRLEQFRKNRDIIEEMIKAKYLEWPIEEPGSVLLKTSDVDKLRRTLGKGRGSRAKNKPG